MTPTEILKLVEELLRGGKRRLAKKLLLHELRRVEARMSKIETALASNLAGTTVIEIAVSLLKKPIGTIIAIAVILILVTTVGAILLSRLEKKRVRIVELLVQAEDCEEDNKEPRRRNSRMNEFAILLIVLAIAYAIIGILLAM